ncbi:EpsG family protein [Parabacteroides sp. AF14-59]|uniref:EpsG family protein n=1 Tax=Parabacteroides sp. AF14-59 TaxID=2292240 RepID=UPI000EFE9A81|nr:EpsG family protein [Parabacteroides sp. AF14-59]RHR98915.1 EpsG family protein [Parabacteroides sp. AF14-59]
MIYLLILFTILFFLYLSEIKGEKSWRIPGSYIIWILFVLVAGLRYRVGGDSLYYQDIYPSFPLFKDLRNYGLYENGYGPLWYLFCATTKAIDTRFFIMQIIHALIINTAMVFFFNKYSRHLLACLLLYYVFYFLYFNMEILRESLAISVFLFNMKNLIDKKWIRYTAGCVLSLGFHLSAVVLFFLPFLMMTLQKKYIKVSLTILFITITGLFYILQNKTDSLTFLPGILLIKMHSYGTREMNNLNGIINNSMPFICYLLIYLVHGRLIRKGSDQSGGNRQDLLFKVFLLFAFLGGFNEGIFRFTNYLTPLAITYSVNVIYDVTREKRKQLGIVVSCLGLFILFAHKSLYYYKDTSGLADHTRRYELWYPYESVFTNKEHYGRELIFYNATQNLIDLRNKK